MYTKTRGLRNNNPGNIRHRDKWQGMSAIQTDDDFIQFDDVKYGIRALNKILITYSKKYGLNTVREIISRWAPPNENDTESYVLSVADKLHVDADKTIDVQYYAAALTTAIIKHENGLQPYSEATIDQGVELAWA